MKKKEYLTPEQEVVELKMEGVILTASDGAASTEEAEEGEGGRLF